VVEDSTATADLVIADVLDQFARNFLLNDLTTEQSGNYSKPHARECLPGAGERLVEETPSLVRFIKRRQRAALRSVLRTFSGLFDAEWSDRYSSNCRGTPGCSGDS